MQHEMRLNQDSFDNIKKGKKNIEIRLNDEKRQKVGIGDTIIFSKLPDLKETIVTKVASISKYRTYEEVVENIPLQNFSGNHRSKKEILDEGCSIYSEEAQKKFGFATFTLELNE